MRALRVAVAFNLPAEGADASEQGVVTQMDLVTQALHAAGYDAFPLPVVDIDALKRDLQELRPHVVFNCCEALNGDSSRHPEVAGVFETLGVPFTGSSQLAMASCMDKLHAKNVLSTAGIPVPAGALIPPMENAHALPWPRIVKPVAEDASVGITDSSVVHEEQAYSERVRHVMEAYGGRALIEEFIDGRELNVAILGDTPLPISELKFDRLAPGTPHIVGFEAKWIPGSPGWDGIVPECPARLDPTCEADARRLALAAAGALGARDYVRVDFRLRPDGRLFVLEVNPNPDINADSGFARSSAAAGIPIEHAVVRILRFALVRAGVVDAREEGGIGAKEVQQAQPPHEDDRPPDTL